MSWQPVSFYWGFSWLPSISSSKYLVKIDGGHFLPPPLLFTIHKNIVHFDTAITRHSVIKSNVNQSISLSTLLLVSVSLSYGITTSNSNCTSSFFIDKPIDAVLLKFPVFYVTKCFITAFMRFCHLSISATLSPVCTLSPYLQNVHFNIFLLFLPRY